MQKEYAYVHVFRKREPSSEGDSLTPGETGPPTFRSKGYLRPPPSGTFEQAMWGTRAQLISGGLAGAVTLALAVTATATAHVPPPRHDEVLSNERTFTRWANVAEIATVYARPGTRSRKVTRLHWLTEDGAPEVYLLLRAHWDRNGQEWVKLRVPMRPNGTMGWVRRQALGAFQGTIAQLVVDRARLQISLYESGKRVWSAPVAVGKPSTPTPAGHFWIREIIPIRDPASGYWPDALGTSDYSTLTEWPGGGVVGIHGPYYEPWGIPGYISHGCIRLQTWDDAWLAHHVGVGTPLLVV
jgi:lipoprotein-anchoring transpeptidase ErfK/SrfK